MNISFEFTALISGCALTVLWLGRLESQGVSNKERSKELYDRVDKMEEKIEALDSRIVDKLSFIERSLAKIEGRLLIENHRENNHE